MPTSKRAAPSESLFDAVRSAGASPAQHPLAGSTLDTINVSPVTHPLNISVARRSPLAAGGNPFDDGQVATPAVSALAGFGLPQLAPRVGSIATSGALPLAAITQQHAYATSGPLGGFTTPSAALRRSLHESVEYRTSRLGRPDSVSRMSDLHELEVEDLSYQNSQLSSVDIRHGARPIGCVVHDQLYIGAYRDICDEAEMMLHNIQAFLCVADDIEEPLPPFITREEVANGAIGFLHLPLSDDSTTRLADHVEQAFAFIDENTAAGRPVALYCQQGKSRSVSFAVAYLMREFGIPLDAALARLRNRYKKADPNLAFVVQLTELQKRYDREYESVEPPLSRRPLSAKRGPLSEMPGVDESTTTTRSASDASNALCEPPLTIDTHAAVEHAVVGGEDIVVQPLTTTHGSGSASTELSYPATALSSTAATPSGAQGPDSKSSQLPMPSSANTQQPDRPAT
jgi:protein-tyrosine phosphatase